MSKFKLNEVLNKFEHLKRDLPQVLANDSVRFFNDSFNKQAWDGAKWQKLKKPRKGGTILVKTGRLKRSIKVQSASFKIIKVISNTPYSQIHNEGFKGVEKVKSHTRRIGVVRKLGKAAGVTDVASHTRKMNMPKRQFMGDSKELTKQHVVKIEKALSTCFK